MFSHFVALREKKIALYQNNEKSVTGERHLESEEEGKTQNDKTNKKRRKRHKVKASIELSHKITEKNDKLNEKEGKKLIVQEVERKKQNKELNEGTIVDKKTVGEEKARRKKISVSAKGIEQIKSSDEQRRRKSLYK